MGVDLKMIAQQLQQYEKGASVNKIHDRLVYMVGTIYSNCIYRMKDDEQLSSDKLWVSLQAEFLKKVMGYHYKKYREALIKHGIIEFKDSYIAGITSMKYRIHEKFIYGACQSLEVTDACVLRQIKKVDTEIQQLKSINLKPVKHLTDVLNTGKLTIDKKATENWINQEDKLYRVKYKSEQQMMAKGTIKKKEMLHPNLRLERHKQLLEDFVQQKYNCSVDAFGNRFHSILTYSPSEFRNFLKYDGLALWSLDLKNSQPYLLNGILHDDFIIREGKFSLKGLHIDMYNHLQKMKKEKKVVIDTSVIPVGSRDEVVKAVNSKQLKPLSIMLQSIAQSHTTKGIQNLNFSSLCQQGLYEFLQQEFSGKFLDKDGDLFSSRDKAKLEVMHMFYCNPKNRKSREEMKPFQEFLKLFPAEGNLLLLLKCGTYKDTTAYKNAPMLLQRMESHLFLDVIAKKLTKLKIPVITIHDSITVPEQYKAVARKVMEDVLQQHIGISPTVTEDEWKPLGS